MNPMCFIPCKMSPGAFSGEIAFEITLEDGKKHLGLASRRYFWTENGERPGKNLQPGTPGYIRARILEEEGKDSVLLSIPDGEVVAVKKTSIRRSERESDVPIGS